MEGKVLQLYNLDADPQQLHDLTSHFGTKQTDTPSSSTTTSSPRKRKSVFYVDSTLEPAYIRLLIGLLRIYNEWEWGEESGSYSSPLFNQRIVKGFLVEQLRRPNRVPADDFSCLEGLDDRSSRFIRECILKGCVISDNTVEFRTQLQTYFAKKDLSHPTLDSIIP